jgi:hypothetical protein
VRAWRRSRDDRRAFRVETHGREAIAYWEGDRAFLFDAAWGAKPRTLFVPAAELWDDVVPEWLRGRREEIVRRLAAETGHRIEPTDEPLRQELRPVTSGEALAIATSFLDRIEGLVGAWEIEAFEPTDRGWQLSYRLAEPAGRGAVRVSRSTGELEVV